MKINIFKKFVVLFSLGFVLFGFNFVNATTDDIPVPVVVTPDTQAPVISPIGEINISIKVGEVYTDAGATASDNVDGDITSSIVIVNNVNTVLAGEYFVTYDVEDKVGNDAIQVKRIVRVEEIVPTPLPPVSIHLEVISNNTDPLYSGNISVVPCDSEGDGVMKATPYCALEQAGIPSEWSDLWINSIGGFSNDFSDMSNIKSWTWIANLDFSNFSLSSKQYELQSNDQILFYFGTNPLKIADMNLSPKVGSELTISVLEPDYRPWPPVWFPSVGAHVVLVGSDSVFDLDSNGQYKINITNTNPIVIKAQKDNFMDSSLITITPVLPTGEENNNGGNGGNNNGGENANNNQNQKIFSVEDALSFLLGNKESASVFVHDWIAIAAGAGDNSDLKSSLVDYLKSNPINSSTVTENERRAMALMALGINPYDGTEIDYIKKITDSFNGTQFDDDSDSDFNDDIFALIVLQNAGYDENDEIIQKTISYIISKQSVGSGSWGSVDMTAAAIMALDEFNNVEGVENAISNAEDYLIESQNDDGGFDNSSSTSWAIQALSLNNSYGDKVDDAIEYLSSKQQDDGGLDEMGVDNRIWNTSYAIPAVLKLSWNDILESFEKEEETDSTSNSQSRSTDIVQDEEIQESVVIIPEETKEIVVAPVEIKVAPVKIAKVQDKKVITPEINIEQVVPEELNKINDNNLLASAGNSQPFLKDKIIIMTIISVLVISVGGWLTNKYI